MAGNVRRLEVQLVSDATTYSKGFDQAQRKTESFSKTVDKTASGSVSKLDSKMGALRNTVKTVVAGFLAFEAIQFGREALDRAEAVNSAYQVTEQVIKQTGEAANVSSGHLKSLARSTALLTGIDKQLVLEADNILLTFKNVRNEVGAGNDVYDEAAGLILDMSTVMKTDAKSAALQLGKALNDPITGISALTRVGVTFSDQQKDQIRTLAASGDVLSAQKIILQELASEFGGTAEASANATDRIKVAADELKEAFGQRLLGALDQNIGNILTLFTKVGAAAIDLGGVFGNIGHLFDTQAAVIGEVDRAFAKAAITTDGYVDSAEEALLTLTFLNPATLKYDEALQHWASSLQLSTDELTRLHGVSDSYLSSLGIAPQEIDKLRAAIGDRLVVAMHDATDEARHAKGATKGLADTAGAAAGPVDAEADAAARAAATNAAMAKSVKAVQDAFLAAADPIFGAVSAVQSYEDAQSNLADVQADSKSTAEDIAQAQLDVAESALRAQSALSDLGRGNISQGIDAIATALNISHTAAEDLLTTLGLLDGKHVTTIIDTRIQSGTIGHGFGDIGHNAGGGRVGKDQPTYVGERGMELFVPDTAGRIIPNSQLSATGDHSTSINIYGNVTDQNVHDIQRELILNTVGRFAETA